VIREDKTLTKTGDGAFGAEVVRRSPLQFRIVNLIA